MFKKIVELFKSKKLENMEISINDFISDLPNINICSDFIIYNDNYKFCLIELDNIDKIDLISFIRINHILLNNIFNVIFFQYYNKIYFNKQYPLDKYLLKLFELYLVYKGIKIVGNIYSSSIPRLHIIKIFITMDKYYNVLKSLTKYIYNKQDIILFKSLVNKTIYYFDIHQEIIFDIFFKHTLPNNLNIFQIKSLMICILIFEKYILNNTSYILYDFVNNICLKDYYIDYIFKTLNYDIINCYLKICKIPPKKTSINSLLHFSYLIQLPDFMCYTLIMNNYNLYICILCEIIIKLYKHQKIKVIKKLLNHNELLRNISNVKHITTNILINYIRDILLLTRKTNINYLEKIFNNIIDDHITLEIYNELKFRFYVYLFIMNVHKLFNKVENHFILICRTTINELVTNDTLEQKFISLCIIMKNNFKHISQKKIYYWFMHKCSNIDKIYNTKIDIPLGKRIMIKNYLYFKQLIQE